jgi:hypothetical protein
MNARQVGKLRDQLGRSFMRRLVEDPLVVVGGEVFSRDRLVREAGCGNFAAAKRLARELEALEIHTLSDLRHLNIEDLARQKGVGETTVYVLMCLQDRLLDRIPEWDGTWRTVVKHNRNGHNKKK